MVVKKENAFKLDGKITYITINKLIAFLKECKRNHIKCVNLSFQEGTMALLPSVATILGFPPRVPYLLRASATTKSLSMPSTDSAQVVGY